MLIYLHNQIKHKIDHLFQEPKHHRKKHKNHKQDFIHQ